MRPSSHNDTRKGPRKTRVVVAKALQLTHKSCAWIQSKWRDASAVKRSALTGPSIASGSASASTSFSLVRSSGWSRSSSCAQVAERQAIVTTPWRSATGSASPATRAPAAADQALKDVATDRADTEKWLKSDPTSYLATVDRRDFGERKMLTVGRAPDNDVRPGGQDVDNLALAFVAPLHPNQNCVGHIRSEVGKKFPDASCGTQSGLAHR